MLKLQGECWVITDHAAGNQRQALALAEHLQLPLRHLVLQPRAPWSWLAPRLELGGRLALPIQQRRLFTPPWPAVAIGCGRAAALFTRMLRRLSDGQCYTVQILNPRIDPARWDTVIAPRHDQLDGPNVLRPLGSLNSVDDEWLADGRESCPRFAELPQPRVGVLLGGPRQGIALNADYAHRLAARLLERQHREGGSLLVLGSRRTSPALVDVFRQALRGVPGLLWAGPDDGRNPYPGVLGWADRLVVTPDSVNMLSEACAVGCPVETLVTAPLPAKLARFHQSLREAGRLHDLGDAASAPPVPPLRETAAIAAALRERIARQQAAQLAD
ncbi:mitochondrial fission ELM1 family protein [Rhodanobacter denitrificans]|uniref:mitochondrial fission ELM1 family protein n=1 Tax=Rhodanobacter denitrificans TaxID=666685 RepID=UPI000260F367|nr:mitochondrial fission ELM1 family protein [Rhodanobacter denitrificans]EIL98966.1 putative nucleoside-diphosphate-sugar epimerase [Rhodanobacter denitrificans]UJM90647.1 mitochondrial fission ELM1 family protein [Rhodanobacter denitrificans]